MSQDEDRGLLLVADDDEVFRDRLARAMQERGFVTATASDVPGALALAQQDIPDAAVVDLRMPGASGMDLIAPLLSLNPEMRIVILTGYGSIASAVESMRQGAVNYVTKPANAAQILAALDRRDGAPSADHAKRPTLAQAEWEHISRVLADTKGNISEAARRLGITRRTLQLKLKKPSPAIGS